MPKRKNCGDCVRYWCGITVFERQGHKLIVGDGFVWDAREEKLYGNHVGYNTYQFREFQLHEAADEHVIRFGNAKATLDQKTGEVSDKGSLLLFSPVPWMAQNDDSELFDAFAYEFYNLEDAASTFETAVARILKKQ